MKLYTFLLFFFTTNFLFAQIPVDEYRKEIINLTSEEQIGNYWAKLIKIDQEILLNTKDSKKIDSISISNMIRTALLFEIHNDKIYKPNNYLPIINLSHNNISDCQIAFWPIIEKCKKTGGIIDTFGGIYPAYELESISLTFYSYSLLNQEINYPNLIEKLTLLSNENVVDNLIVCFEKQKELEKLKVIKVLNKWHIEIFENTFEDGFFEFVKMSDKNIYIRKKERLQKLICIKSNKELKIYQIENDPFGWTFEYKKDGSLFLKDENNNTLISYNKFI
jgi:hypothetical protein